MPNENYNCGEPRRLPALTEVQWHFLKRAARLGRRIKCEHSEIAQEYRGGSSIAEIINTHRFSQTYGVGEALAVAGVKKAFHGHSGTYGVAAYGGLIDGSELELLCTEHRSEAGRRNGRRAAELRGYTLWGIREAARMRALEVLPKYHTSGGVDNAAIANVLNREFHDDNPVRDRVSVYNKRYAWRVQQNR